MVLGLLGRLKLQLRASQFHKRRRLNGNRFAVAPALEGLEVRSLLSGTALGGTVFTPVDFQQVANYDVRGVTKIGDSVILYGGDDAGHGRADELKLVDGVFEDVNSWVFKSPYEQLNPSASSYASVGGVSMSASGPMFAVQASSTADKFSYGAYFVNSSGAWQYIPATPVYQTSVIGVTSDGTALLDAGIGAIATNDEILYFVGELNEFRSATAVSNSGVLFGGFLVDENFNSVGQLWDSQGNRLTTSFSSSPYTVGAFLRLQESPAGFIGVARAADSGGVGDIIVNVTPAADGYTVTPITELYGIYSIHAATQIGSSVYYVTDDSYVPNDGVIRLRGSSETIDVSSLLPTLDGVQDVVVNELAFDPIASVWYVQGYSKKASGDESWLLSLAVDPEVPAKPVPNFQNIPFKNGVESLVSWDAVDGAASYVVQINNLTTRTVERKVTVSVPELAVTLANAGTYAIWVQAVGATGKAGPWSDGTRFTVVPRPPAISYETDTFRWTDIGAAQYDLWVNNQSGQRVVNQQTSATSFTASLPPGTYTAWVKPDAEVWSTPYRFVVYHDAIAVDPLKTLDSTPVITWAGPADGNYDVYVSREGQSAAVFRQTVTGNSVELPAMARGVYTVWAQQLHADGSVSRWGTGATLDIAERPVLSLTGSTLSWTAYVSAVHYELWVSTDANENRIAVVPTFVSGTSLDLSTLTGLSSGNFRVWVRAVSDASTGLFETSRWGFSKSFTV